MKLDQTDEASIGKSKEGDQAQSPSRRKFLRSTSTTALVTSLAAQPVWGQCTVSGAISGASTSPTNADSCFIPPLIFGAGRSPGFWSSAMYNGNAVISAFPSYRPQDRTNLRCHIDSVKNANSYSLPSTPPQFINVANALSNPGGTGGNNWNLAAIWLDAYFGFFGNAALPGNPLPTPQDWVDHFYPLYIISGESDSVFNSVFDDGNASTSWMELPAGNSCCP